jgi:hypothetical protein
MLKSILLQLFALLFCICMPNIGFTGSKARKALKCSAQFGLNNTLRDLHFTVTKWLEWVKPSAKKSVDEMLEIYVGATPFVKRFKLGSEIDVAGEKVKVLHHLGAGGAGAVFLVQSVSKQKLFVVKILYDEQSFHDHVYFHSEQEDLPKLTGMDLKNRVILLEYKEGIPVAQIRDHGQKFGFSPEQIKEVMKRYERLHYNDQGPDNIIFSPKTGGFFLIDPN